MNIAEHVAADLNQPVAFFSLEMSKEELVLRLLSSRANVDGQKLRKGMASREEIKRITEAAGYLYTVPLYIDDSPGLRVLDLRAKARRLYMRHSIKLLLVDYLQLMSGPGAEESRQVEVANISRSLKAVARELRIPVLAVAQLRRPAVNQPRDMMPQLSDLRESGAIEQDADVVLLLDRQSTRLKPGSPDYDAVANEAELIIAKQRNGPTGLVKLVWQREFTRFRAWSPREGPAPSAASGAASGGADLVQYGSEAEVAPGPDSQEAPF
jgi:replicative DNA helicase